MVWPIGLTVFLILFIGGLIGFLFYSTTLRFDLVEENYYQKGLQYQKTIDRKNRSKALSQDLSWEIDSNKILHLKFPDVAQGKEITGKIRLFRPSDARLDRSFPLNLSGNNEQTINLNGLAKGLWRIKILWQTDENDYYFEEAITLN